MVDGVSDFALSTPARTLFGRGSRNSAIPAICDFGNHILIVRGGSVDWADHLADALTQAGCQVAELRGQGEPDVDAVAQGAAAARDHRTNCVVALGGGSIIDLGKAIAGLAVSDGSPADYLELGPTKPRRLNDPLPFVAIPTTAGTGAEATRNAVIGVPDRQAKISLRDPRLIPDLAVIDPALTDGSPRELTLASGLDAITQLIESYLCNRANPVTDALCAATIPDAVAALAALMRSDNPAARDVMARASYLSGVALANSGLGIVHGLASVIGAYGAPHGAICGRLLAPSLAVNAEAARRLGHDTTRFELVDRWLASGLSEYDHAAQSPLVTFVRQNGLVTLQAMGITAEISGEIADKALTASSTKANSVPLTATDIAQILATAGD